MSLVDLRKHRGGAGRLVRSKLRGAAHRGLFIEIFVTKFTAKFVSEYRLDRLKLIRLRIRSFYERNIIQRLCIRALISNYISTLPCTLVKAKIKKYAKNTETYTCVGLLNKP